MATIICSTRMIYQILFISILLTLFNIGISGTILSSIQSNISNSNYNNNPILYTDVTEANRIDSLERIKSVPIKVYEFKYDKVEGRKKMGVLGADAHYYFPESIEVVPSYVFANKDKTKPSTTLENFPIVDKNVIFMHGVAALQELLIQFDQIKEMMNKIEIIYQQNELQINMIETKLNQEINQQLIEKKDLLQIEIDKQLKDNEISIIKQQQSQELSIQQKEYEESLLHYEIELNKKRLDLQQEQNEKNMLLILQIEKEKIIKREEIQYEKKQLLQFQKIEYEQAIEDKKNNLEIEKMKIEIELKSKHDRLNEDINLRKLQLEAKLSIQKTIDMMTMIWNSLLSLLSDFLSKPLQLLSFFSVFFIIYLIYYIFIQMIQILREWVQNNLGKPTLVRETSYSYWSIFPLNYFFYGYQILQYMNPFYWLYCMLYFVYQLFGNILNTITNTTTTSSSTINQKNQKLNIATMKYIQTYFQETVILDDENMEKILQLAISTRNSITTKTPYRNVLFHGPPGTGKTLIARQLAKASGMDYAIMSGGDVCSLSGGSGGSAVDQLHALFKWASQSNKGLLLFIDEAEAFLSSRNSGSSGGSHYTHTTGTSGSSSSTNNYTNHSSSSSSNSSLNNTRNALNALLYQTGIQSNSFMMVLATNRPEDLDAAVLDRIDISMYIGLPQYNQRKAMIILYQHIHINQYIHNLYTIPWYNVFSLLFQYYRKKQLKNQYLLEADTCFNEHLVSEIALLLEGFSGREISKLFISIHHAILLQQHSSSSSSLVTVEMIMSVVKQKVADHKQMISFRQ